MPYRLHIDIPLGEDEMIAYTNAETIMKLFRPPTTNSSGDPRVSGNGAFWWREIGNNVEVNYRLGHDEDRQKSNYLDKNENGHVSNKKTRITL